MELRDIITRDVEVVGAGASLKEAVGRMKSLDVELLPVCDSDQLQGFLPIVILPYAQLRTVAMRKKLPSKTRVNFLAEVSCGKTCAETPALRGVCRARIRRVRRLSPRFSARPR